MELQDILNVGGGSALTILGWFARNLWDAVQQLKTDLSTLREQIARDYVPKDDFKSTIGEIREMFRHISDKLDQKADK